jgi:hypothetical protein
VLNVVLMIMKDIGTRPFLYDTTIWSKISLTIIHKLQRGSAQAGGFAESAKRSLRTEGIKCDL